MEDPASDERPAIVASTGDIEHAGRVAQTADVLELRLDLGEATIDDLAGYGGTPPLLLTDRDWPLHREPGGGLLREALELADVWGVDVDRATFGDGEVEAIVRRSGATLVCSAHLDTADDLAEAVATVDALGDIGKVAVRCDDGDTFARLVEHAVDAVDEPLALMATGPYGPHSRLLAVALEQPLVYGHVPEATPTATGQLDVETLRTVRQALATSA
ncbi:MAG: type I 3-dehydroquinate dehydratase [Halobacteriales archaeon]